MFVLKFVGSGFFIAESHLAKMDTSPEIETNPLPAITLPQPPFTLKAAVNSTALHRSLHAALYFFPFFHTVTSNGILDDFSQVTLARASEVVAPRLDFY